MPPIVTMGFGRTSVSSASLDPRPPANITAFTYFPSGLIHADQKYEANIIL